MADGFLGRWARRKEAVRKGEVLPAEPEVVKAPPSPPQPAPAAVGSALASSPPLPAEGQGRGSPAEPPPPPTLEDVESLTPSSDFSRYVQADVSPEVRNAAVKKLWADPRFNIQDGLDVYIDDYGKPDPIPPAMLRSLASAKFLNLFEEEEEKEKKELESGQDPTARVPADAPPDQTVAQSGTADSIPPAVPTAEHHADPDLRLQQDDAPGPRDPGAGSS